MRNNWTREELILAFNLYCKLPYGRFNNRSKEVNELAEIIGRSPGAVAFKLVNFVSLDPKQQLLGRKGAKNIGKLDKEIFEEFSANFDECFYNSENILNKTKSKKKNEDILKIDKNKTGKTVKRETKVRINQDYFRTIVMSNYSKGCAITGINIPELLIASHIKPWSKDKKNRLNPSNGICLSATLDKAFDKGLITINKKLQIIFSSEMKKYAKEFYYEDEIAKYEGKQLFLPVKFLPSNEFVEYHNDVIFKH